MQTHLLDGRLVSKTHNRRWVPNLQIAHLNIVDFCNLRCPNCQSFCVEAPSDKHIPLECIRQFVDDSIRLRWRWRVVKLYGGEPVLHPHIGDLCAIIGRYRDFYCSSVKASPFAEKNCQFVCDTNGSPQAVQRAAEHLPPWFSTQNARTLQAKAWHGYNTVNVAPIDRQAYRDANPLIFCEGCNIPESCGGVSLHTNGQYYPCPIAGHIDRVFQLGTGIDGLEAFLKAGIRHYRNVFYRTCRYCGWFKYPREVVSEQVTSPTWVQGFADYRVRTRTAEKESR
jgi:hypothetical protein